MATVSRPRSGRENLQYFADLQRQVAERVAPLRTRERQRHRARLRRVVVRTVLVLVPLLVVTAFVVQERRNVRRLREREALEQDEPTPDAEQT